LREEWHVHYWRIKRMCREVVYAYFKVLSWNLLRMEENHKKPLSRWHPSWDMCTPEYKAGVLTMIYEAISWWGKVILYISTAKWEEVHQWFLRSKHIHACNHDAISHHMHQLLVPDATVRSLMLLTLLVDVVQCLLGQPVIVHIIRIGSACLNHRLLTNPFASKRIQKLLSNYKHQYNTCCHEYVEEECLSIQPLLQFHYLYSFIVYSFLKHISSLQQEKAW